MSQATAEVEHLAGVLGRCRDRDGRWPTRAELLREADDLPSQDPWGRDYLLEAAADGRAATIRSCGGDGERGTADDLCTTRRRDPAGPSGGGVAAR